jgi:hypothetical protein
MKPPRRLAPGPTPPDLASADDLDFAALMQRDGVTPVARPRAKAPSVAPAKPAAKAPSVAPAKPAAKAPSVAPAKPAAKAPSVAPAKPVPGPTPGPASRPSVPRELAELAARNHALTQERDAASIAVAASRAELAALVARNHALTQERDAATLAMASRRAEATATEAALRAELGSTRAALRAAQASADPPRSSLAAALLARGLVGGPEQAHALALLTEGEAASRVLDLLETRDPAALASLLERRLALVCGAAGCAPELGAAALQVAPARCEVCGGSDIQRAAHGFVRACVAAGLARVRFVGGSPNYRTKLAALFPAGGPLTVHTTAGDKRVRLNRSRSQQRGDDLVIIWGATELDHATSGVYRAEHGRTEIIAHRGIGRMLELAAARIGGAAPVAR